MPNRTSIAPRVSRVIATAVTALTIGWLVQPGSVTAQEPALDVIYVPTPQEVVDKMLEMAKVTKNDYVIDLGSGDGRIPITAAKKYGATAFGIDLNPQRIQEAQENLKKEKLEGKVTFKEGNLFEEDLTKADVITMYLLTSINLKLRPELLKLKPGTRIVSHAFDMGDWQADQRESIVGKTAYLWIVPAQIDGAWDVTDKKTGKNFALNIAQKYQEFTGTARMDDKSVDIANGKINGANVSFELTGEDGQKRVYEGKLAGDKLEGEDWSASKS